MAACPRGHITACDLLQKLLIITNHDLVLLQYQPAKCYAGLCPQHFSTRGSGPNRHTIFDCNLNHFVQRPGFIWESHNCQVGFFSSDDSVNQCSILVQTCGFYTIGLNFYNSKWHEQAVFLHFPKDTCASALGPCLPGRLRVLCFHSCASDWFETFITWERVVAWTIDTDRPSTFPEPESHV